MTKVGITYNPTQPLFYSGANQTALVLYELFLKLGYTVVFVDYTNDDSKWWSDYPMTPSLTTTNLYQTSGLDLLVDVDGLVSADYRAKAASKTVVFLRTFLQFSEMDSTVYIDSPYVMRTMENVSEVWCWDILNPLETLPSIQVLFPCPIKRVPFIWSSAVASHYSNGRISDFDSTLEWMVHVAEKNTNNTSSSVLPLVAIREMITNNVLGASYQIHNADKIKDNRFLKENVLHNIEMEKLPIAFMDKQPFHLWLTNSILFSHSRFTYLRIGLLNSLWMGIPLIHNSCVLRDLHTILGELFYTGNDIQDICRAFTAFVSKPSAWFSAIQDIRTAIMDTFSITVKQDAWTAIIQGISTIETPRPKAITMPTVIPTAISTVKPDVNGEKKLKIAFIDMWPGFNPATNFIIDAMQQECTVQGSFYKSTDTSDLVICGPYTESWKTISPTIPKVFFSAENWAITEDPRISLYLTSSRQEDSTHMRIPTWMTFLDWFSGSTVLPEGCEDNPIRIPLHFATRVHPVSFEERQKFCGFVVSNPICEFRNKTFLAMNQYKTVNSGGALFNNINGQLSLKYPGGGCGDISKYHFFSDHQFSISFENSQASGYITEKLLHAKIAGCVPLYWGDSDKSDFVDNSFINLSHVSDPNMVVQIMKKLESKPTICSTIASTPILNEEKKQKALLIIKNMTKRLLELASKKNDVEWLEGIDKTYVINLDTRPDRLENLYKAIPELSSVVERIPGVNGKTLQMTKEIYDMFDRNEFQWKKSIIGCNMSHISVWKKIAAGPEGSKVLVLEDDVRFYKDWKEQWKKCVTCIPEDADVLYLGGVLPPNMSVLPMATQEVNAHWSKIKANTFFCHIPAEVFHFCAYSYILTQRGAQKIMRYLNESEKKSFTVSDHLLGHPAVGLNKYFTNPLLAYCFQDDDPMYRQSQFNDLHREDSFDSDIWNNKECFSEVELAPFRPGNVMIPKKTVTVYYMQTDSSECKPYEQAWLEEMMNVSLVFMPLRPETGIVADSWFLVQRPHSPTFAHIFSNLQQLGMPFYVLHLSDEFCTDDISFYGLSCCKGVIRNYLRSDLPSLPHVVTIPLGYHHVLSCTQKSYDQRELMWSFHGTDWFGRKEQLESLVSFVPHSCSLQPEWNHPTATKEAQYLSLLGNSKFCPVLKGNNVETFRFYEALEAGALPITPIVDSAYLGWVGGQLDLSSLYEWTNPESVLRSGVTEEIRLEVMKRWSAWKLKLKEDCKRVMKS